MNGFQQYMQVSDEVKSAIGNNKPVVALESTIISHGFQYPENIKCAAGCEKIIREEGAVPATIAIIDGFIKIGLSETETLRIANSGGIPKCSRRDAAPLIAGGGCGATTVSATMLFAQMAGIKVFATGGIGGVHRRGHETFDISSDLQELAKTKVAVVCAGVKSILDIPLTREYLETHGIAVLGYRTDVFPAFYTRESPAAVDYNIASASDIAKVIKTKEDLGTDGGILIVNPIPEEDEPDPAFINSLIDGSVRLAEEQGIKGKDITPFILKHLHEKSGGLTVKANKALVHNNARLAAQIACELCK